MVQAFLLLCLLAFPVLVLIGAARDLTSYTIPNWISLALVAAFVPAFAAAWAAGAPVPGLVASIGVGAVALMIGIAMFMLGWVGGGDAKLFAACALWLGWSALTGVGYQPTDAEAVPAIPATDTGAGAAVFVPSPI